MKRRNFTYMFSVLLFTTLLAAAPSAMAEIYSWTDENNVRHYSDTPPGGSGRVEVTREIPHDQEADQRNREAHQAMLQQVEVERREFGKRELEERLKRTEKKLQAAERKAEQALVEAKEARNIAEEKQRRREVYVVPWIGPRNNQIQRSVPYDPYQTPSIPCQTGLSN